MNERIKELAEQAGFRSNPNVYDRNQSFDVKKFAELIIDECIALNLKELPFVAFDRLLNSYNEHFGMNDD